MFRRRRFIVLLLGIIILLIAYFFTVQQHSKRQDYFFELSQIDSALGLLIKYSQNCIESPNTNDFAAIVNELSNISTAVDSLYLQNAGIDVNVRHELYDIVDNMNGIVLSLDDKALIEYSNDILAASKNYHVLFDDINSVSTSDLAIATKRFVNSLSSIMSS